MDIKEKLVELLDRVQQMGVIYKENQMDERYPTIEQIRNTEVAARLIAYGVTVPQWISVDDKLPKPFTPVLVYRKSFGTLPPYINIDKMVLWNNDTQVWTDEMKTWKAVTTHWMPLPEPPKGE